MLVALVVVGCGGDDEPAERPPAPIPPAFVEDVDAVCADIDEQVDELTRERPRSESEVLQTLSDFEAVLADGVRQLEALRPPAGAAGERVRRSFGATEQEVERVVASIEEDLTAAVEGDDAAARRRVRRLEQLEGPVYARLDAELGARGCA